MDLPAVSGAVAMLTIQELQSKTLLVQFAATRQYSAERLLEVDPRLPAGLSTVVHKFPPGQDSRRFLGGIGLTLLKFGNSEVPIDQWNNWL